jgi:hypothetical protein
MAPHAATLGYSKAGLIAVRRRMNTASVIGRMLLLGELAMKGREPNTDHPAVDCAASGSSRRHSRRNGSSRTCR